jgi:hypothetical protein
VPGTKLVPGTFLLFRLAWSLDRLTGKISPKMRRIVVEWVKENAEILMENWQRARRKEKLLQIPVPKVR